MHPISTPEHKGNPSRITVFWYMHCLAHPWNYIYIYLLYHKLSVHCCTILLYNFEHVKTQFVADDCIRKERNFVKHHVEVIYIHAHIYICKHTYIHTYRQTDIHTYIYIHIYHGHYSNWLRTTKSYCNIFGSKHLYIYTHVCVFDTY